MHNNFALFTTFALDLKTLTKKPKFYYGIRY